MRGAGAALIESSTMSLQKTLPALVFVLTVLHPATHQAQDGPIAKPAPVSEGFQFRGGNPVRGQKAFAILNCIQCHTVKNINLPEPLGKRRIDLKLASEVQFVKRYEDIILAITSPRHIINERYRAILTNIELQGAVEPLMPDLTDHMTARQLMDLTAFLNQIYSKELPGYGKPEAE